MLDQSFSAYNFNLIFLKENRKGKINKSHLNKSYFDKHEEFNEVLKEKLDLKSFMGALTPEELESFAERLDKINKEKEQIRQDLFTDYANKINDEDNPYHFNIKYDKQHKIYTGEKDGCTYYTIKQMQRNINKTFKVIQADRNTIIKQIYNSISDGFPKVIIRTDIKKFYESIPQDKLFEKFEDNTLLSPLTKKLLKRLFYEFERIKDTSEMLPQKGIPRGLGVSAYLSELYMREIDTEIKSMPDIIFYARYVDDIIAIFCPKTKSLIGNYQNEIKDIIKQHNLEIKDGSDGEPTKTFTYNLMDNPLSMRETLTFLGYKFIIKQNHQIKIELSDNKLIRYTKRIKASIDTYNMEAKYNERIARKLLLDRLKFLTGNYHLNHNKKNIKAGIFYSNQMLGLNRSGFSSLNTLNNRMYGVFNSLNPPVKIGINKNHLIDFLKSKFCFEDGFKNKEKNYYSFKFNSKEQNLYNAKFKKVTNKFEVIKSIWRNE